MPLPQPPKQTKPDPTTDSSPEPWWGTSWQAMTALLVRVLHAALIATTLIGAVVAVTLAVVVLLHLGILGAVVIAAVAATALATLPID